MEVWCLLPRLRADARTQPSQCKDWQERGQTQARKGEPGKLQLDPTGQAYTAGCQAERAALSVEGELTHIESRMRKRCFGRS